MGTGAVFGLTSALVGETLPGSGPAVATGNALAEGPVVFYWPQQIIDELEQNAKLDGNNEWLQLRVDLFRQGQFNLGSCLCCNVLVLKDGCPCVSVSLTEFYQ